MKYIELFKNGFDSTITEKIKPENWPYVGYSPSEGLLLTDILKETPINYFYIESLDDNNVITLDSTTWAGYGDNKSKLEYSTDTTSWNSMNDVDSITINNGERLYMRCIEGNICKDMYSIPEEESETVMFAPLFKTSTNCNVGGNINTVMFDYTYKNEDCVLPAYAFASLFEGIDMTTEEPTNYIIDASKLVLPTIELTEGCYSGMFCNCTSLTTTPELPSTTLAEWCYSSMFENCTSLTAVPVLRTTELAEACYVNMFYNCASLTVTPELPATMLAVDCYLGMFYDCTSLTTTPELHATELAGGCYDHMFGGCTSLTTVPELPATELAEGCYYGMFENCTSLTVTPELPATELAVGCYREMFYNCTSLTVTPELPATTLVDWCYDGMFAGCTSLTTVPEILPATELAEYCYSGMFADCTSLTTAPELPATKLAWWCYSSMFNGCTSLTTAPELPATELAHSCYWYMFYDCTSLTSAPELPATELPSLCYTSMFENCTSLTTAPELPAAELANSCYSYMFHDCTSLNYIKCLATDISAAACTHNWVDNVSLTGTFIKHPDMNSWPTGYNGIPSGWSMMDADTDTDTVVDTENGYQLIDLGLPSGLKWADRNVGAETPQDNGLYFSWGNVEGHAVNENGKIADGYVFNETIYDTTLGGQYTGDELDAEHDAATVNIGSNWRMPTRVEINELVQNTVHYYISEDGNIVAGPFEYGTNSSDKGLDGSKLRSICFVKRGKEFKYNNRSNFIEFPFTGCCSGILFAGGGSSGNIWSSSIVKYGRNLAYELIFTSDGIISCDNYSNRLHGQSIRGVHA